MKRAAITVTGIGLATPAGLGTKTTWQRLLEGRPTAARDPELDGLPVDFSCRVPDDDLAQALGRGLRWRTDRFTQLALVAAREAVADAGLYPEEWDGDRVGVVIGVGGSSFDHNHEIIKAAQGQFRAVMPSLAPRTHPSAATGEVSLDLAARGPSLCASTACASGATALGVAKLLLETGTCDIAIAGGAESVRNAVGSVAFWRLGALSERIAAPHEASRPFDADRDGFVLAEGAGVLVLEREDDARARCARRYATLAGYGSTADAYHCVAPHPDGDGAARAIATALADADLSPGDVDHVNTHGTSIPLNDLAEARALRRVFPLPPPVTATKSILGHAVGGAGAIEAACSVLTLHHQTIHPTANVTNLDPRIDLDVVTGAPRHSDIGTVVSNSFGFGGHNAVLVFCRP